MARPVSQPKTCPVCNGRSKDGHLCHRCVSHCTGILQRVGQSWHDLTVTLARLDRLGPRAEGHSIGNTQPLPIGWAAVELRHHIRATLVRWTKITIDEMGADYPHDTVPALCRHLIAWAPQLRKREDAARWHEDLACHSWRRRVAGLDRHITTAVDHPDERASVPAGPCPQIDDEGEHCAGQTVAHFPADPTERAWIDCPLCGWRCESTDWTAGAAAILARQRQLDRGEQLARYLVGAVSNHTTAYTAATPWLGHRVFMTVADASLTYGIPEDTIRRASREGRLTRRTYDARVYVAVDEMRTYHDSWLMRGQR